MEKKLSNNDKVVISGKVLSINKGGIVEVAIVVGDKEKTVIAYPSGKMRKNGINMLVGDIVDLEMSPYDWNKGRVIFRRTK